MREVDNWPLGYLAREATRNVMSWGARLFPVLLIAVLLGSGVAALGVKESRNYEARIASLAAQGRNMINVYLGADNNDEKYASNEGISRRSCENLNGMSGVVVAGLIDPEAETFNVAQISSHTPVRAVSSSLLPQLFEYDVVIGGALAENGSIDPDAVFDVITAGGAHLTAVVKPEIGPRVPSTLAAFVTLSPETKYKGTCAVLFDQRVDSREMAPLVESAVSSAGGYVASQNTFSEQMDVKKEYLDRIERLAAPAAGAFGGLILAILAFMRSSELAAYRLSGTSPRSLGMMLTFESALIAGTFFTAAAIGVAIFRNQLLSPPATLLWAATGAGVWMIVAWILALPVLRRKPSDMAKDR